jgi:hypothetical protein
LLREIGPSTKHSGWEAKDQNSLSDSRPKQTVAMCGQKSLYNAEPKATAEDESQESRRLRGLKAARCGWALNARAWRSIANAAQSVRY